MSLAAVRVLGAAGVLAALALPVAGKDAGGGPLEERLNEARLSEQHRGAETLRNAAHPSTRSGSFQDVRSVLHCHSQLSHDSRGTEEQIVAAARAAGVRAIFMSEHPTADRRWLTEGLNGERGGVLFIPGVELSDGLLLWRTDGREWAPESRAADVLETLSHRGPGSRDVAFICHPEQRARDEDWTMPPFAGMEIYNSHADAEDSNYQGFLKALLANPFRMFATVGSMKKYPQEAFAAIFDEQTTVLKRWDGLNTGFLASGRRVVGIAGNDSHQNVGIRIEPSDEGLAIRDGLGKIVSQVPRKKVPLLFLGQITAGKPILAHTFDPYEVSFRYVSTHLLATGASEDALFDALLKGRTYVSFDWMAEPGGFRYTARAGKRTIEMGGSIPATEKPVLTVRPNMPCEIRLLRDGQEVRRTTGQELTLQARDPGAYRAEAWVEIAGERRPWIYSNPIFVLPPVPKSARRAPVVSHPADLRG